MNTDPIVLQHTDNPESARDIVLQQHPEFAIHTCDTYAGLSECLDQSRAEVVYSVRFNGTPDFPRRALLESDHVKWISVGGSGTDHLLPVYTSESLPDLLPLADLIVVAVPLLPSTRHLLSIAEFAVMKSNAVLIDVSRGGVVDESALVQALTNGSIEGAALDVFAQEPLPEEHVLWEMDNVIITPH